MPNRSARPTLPHAAWLEQAPRAIAATTTPAPAEAAPTAKPRRNLLFSSSSRKERERAQARTSRAICGRSSPRSACRPAAARTSEAAACDVRRRLAEIGTREAAESAAAAAQRPGAIDLYRSRWPARRHGSLSAGRAKRGSAAGDGAQIGRRRWNGLFAVFRRLDRGADARRHDAVRLDRRTARAPRPAPLSATVLPANLP